MDYKDKVRELQRQVAYNRTSPVAMDIFAEAIRLADTHNDIPLGAQMRLDACYFAPALGKPELIMVYFPWVFSHFQQDDRIIPMRDMRLFFTILFTHLADYHTIPYEFIQQTKQDYIHLAETTQLKKAIFYFNLRELAVCLGEIEEAKKYHAAYELAPPITEVDFQTRDISKWEFIHGRDFLYYHFLEDYDKAWKSHLKSLSEKRDKVFDVIPWYGNLAMISVLSGKFEQGIQELPVLFKILRRETQLKAYSAVGELILFLTHTLNFNAAIQLFELYLPIVMENRETLELCIVWLAFGRIFEVMNEKGYATVRTKLPENFPAFDPGQTYESSELADIFLKKSRELIQKFDVRNGNSFYSEYYQRFSKAHVVPERIPFNRKGK